MTVGDDGARRAAGPAKKVVLCDEHHLFMEALSVVLETRGYSVVACVADPEAAVEVLAATPVALCVIELNFRGGTSISGIERIVAMEPATRVVVLSGSVDAALVNEALAAGAHGLASKGEVLDSIIDVIERVCVGEVVVQRSALRTAWHVQATEPAPAHHLARFLTPREREILEHLVMGETTAELANNLGVRYSTVRTHIQSILEKLGVHSKLEAVAYAVQEGIVPVRGQRTVHRTVQSAS